MTAPITVGLSYQARWTVVPPSGFTAADVTTFLTGSSGQVDLIDEAAGTSELSAVLSVDASARTLTLLLADADTGALTPGTYVLRIQVTKSGQTYPVRRLDRPAYIGVVTQNSPVRGDR